MQMLKAMIRGSILASAIAFLGYTLSAAQEVHPTSSVYVWPDDPLVREKLEKWRDLKFGMIIHWGIYAQAGIVESWSICSEDWIERDSTISYADYKKWYWDLSKEFNPTKFNPEQWARQLKMRACDMSCSPQSITMVSPCSTQNNQISKSRTVPSAHIQKPT